MANENENRALRKYSNRKKRYKRIRNVVIIMLLIVVIVVGAVYLVWLYNRSYNSCKIMKSTELTEGTVEYVSYGSSVVKYGKDGAEAIDKDGKRLWNGSYEMSDPIIDTCGKYVVIADRGGKSVHIYNNKGEAGKYTTSYDIVKAEVAYQGVVALLMQEGDTNYIELHDLDNTVLGESENTVNNAGYPMDISLSNDGTKLAVICLSINEGDLISKVGFYNFSEVGSNYKDQYVGGWAFGKGVIAPRIAFLNNDTACVFENKGFVICEIKEILNSDKKIRLNGKIQSILYNANYTGVVLEAADGSAKHLMLYNLKGKKVLDKKIDFEYKKIFLTDEEIIMYDDLTCIVMKMNGKVKFKYIFDSNIAAFYPINNLDRYFYINETKLSDIQLTE